MSTTQKMILSQRIDAIRNCQHGDENGTPCIYLDEFEEIAAIAKELLSALGLASSAMNHMGDIMNNMDIVQPEDNSATDNAFLVVRNTLRKHEGPQFVGK